MPINRAFQRLRKPMKDGFIEKGKYDLIMKINYIYEEENIFFFISQVNTLSQMSRFVKFFLLSQQSAQIKNMLK